MAKQCISEGCANPVFGGDYCLFHQYKRKKAEATFIKSKGSKINASESKPVRRAFKPIKRASAKRSKLDYKYSKKARAFKIKNPYCAIRSPVCVNFTEGVHHKRGKATEELYLDESYWLPACNPCNTYIEDNSEWAKENGFKEADYSSKLSKFKK